MKQLTLSIFILFLLNGFTQGAKDSVLLLNGKSYTGDITGTSFVKGDSVLSINWVSKKGKTFTDNIEMKRIFSYTDNGISKTVYYPNEFLGDFLTIRETHDVTIGSFDSRKMFKPHVPFWSGFAIGLGATIWDTYLTKNEANDTNLVAPKEPGFFKSSPSIFPFLVPVVVSAAWAIPSFKVKKKKMIHLNYHGNENYYRGYHRIAKQKRMLGGLFGSLSGIALGMLGYFIFR